MYKKSWPKELVSSLEAISIAQFLPVVPDSIRDRDDKNANMVILAIATHPPRTKLSRLNTLQLQYIGMHNPLLYYFTNFRHTA